MRPAVKRTLVPAALVLALAAGGLYAWQKTRASGPGEGFVSGNGRIEATEVDVAAKLGGRLQALLVDEGAFVKAGQKLAEMQVDVLNAQHDEAQARYAETLTAVVSANAQVSARESDHAAALAVVVERESELDAAQRRLTRSQTLPSKGVSTMQTLDDDQARVNNAQAAVTAARAQAAAGKAAINAARAQVSGAQSTVRAAEATIARIQADITDSVLTAPRDGRVQYRVAQPGEVLSAGGKVLNFERRRRIDNLTQSTGLQTFLARPAGKLSGGMKQKLGLCCALIHDPDLLILHEPTTGVDPLARTQFWRLIAEIRQQRPQMSVLVATAYMDEAQGFDWLVVMDDGKVLDTGTPAELLQRTGRASLEEAFIELLPDEKKQGYAPIEIPPLSEDGADDIAIKAEGLTMRFGDFTAVDDVSFRIRRGEIFGFLGSNGCGKSTTMKMLTGLLPASEGQAWLFGHKVNTNDIGTRRRVREKEMGSIINLYVTPVTRTEFVLGKQLPYVGLAMINSGLMTLMAVTLFDVPVTGSFLTLALASLVFCFVATGMGLLASAVTSSQIAALFFAMTGTMIPATQFGGMIDPVSSLEGAGRLIGQIYPASHMFDISRGVFNKGLRFGDLAASLWPLLLSVPVITGAAIALLKKQER